MKIGISGASGQLGQEVLSQLVQRGTQHSLIGISRSPQIGGTKFEGRFGDYNKPDSLAKAYEGLDRLLVIPSADLAPGVRGSQLRVAINAAKQAGVAHVFLISAAGTHEAAPPSIFNRYTYQPVVTRDDPAQLLAGGNIVLSATQINNQQSKIVAGGNITATAAAIDNQSVVSQQRVRDVGTQWSWGVTGGHDDCYPCHWVLDWGYVASGYDTTAYTTMPVASGVSGNNRSTSTTQARSTATVPTNPATSGVLNSALFRNTSNPAANYLIETDPRFASYKTWLSSDYMLTSLAIDPALTQKRLGDGFYEQRLINEQVAQLTGRRFLANYTSEEQQYQALMNAGVTYAQSHNLRPGIALTAEQVSRLTSDVVWLVEKDVTLPDGSTQRALVPQVYAIVRDGDLSNTGSLFSGKSVQLAASGDITNSGIFSAQQLDLKAANLNNNAGTVTGQQVSIATTQDINNKGGTLSAKSSLSMVAGRDINNITRIQAASGANKTTLDRSE